MLDLYTDYLLSSFGQTSATGLSRLVEGEVSHDAVTRFLAQEEALGKTLWNKVKPLVRKVQSAEGILVVDDTVIPKPHMDENDLIAWHYDHTEGRVIKGVNLLSTLYVSQGVSVPISFTLVKKTEEYIDTKTGEARRRSPKSKNQMYQEMLKQALRNQIPFTFVLNDVWFGSSDNMNFVKLDLKKEFLMPLKANRNIALSEEEKRAKQYQRVDSLALEEEQGKLVYLEAVPFPVLLCKRVFENKDGSVGVLYLVSSDPTQEAPSLLDLYQRRWKVEEYHKSLKQNAGLGKSPASSARSQGNHLFASLCAFVKLEAFKIKTALNHFALKQKLYLEALRAAFATFRGQPDRFLFA